MNPVNLVSFFTFGLSNDALLFLIVYLIICSILANIGLLKISLTIFKTENLQMEDIVITSILTGLVVWIPVLGSLLCVIIICYRHTKDVLKAIGVWAMSILLSHILLLIIGLEMIVFLFAEKPFLPFI